MIHLWHFLWIKCLQDLLIQILQIYVHSFSANQTPVTNVLYPYLSLSLACWASPSKGTLYSHEDTVFRKPCYAFLGLNTKYIGFLSTIVFSNDFFLYNESTVLLEICNLNGRFWFVFNISKRKYIKWWLKFLYQCLTLKQSCG